MRALLLFGLLTGASCAVAGCSGGAGTESNLFGDGDRDASTAESGAGIDSPIDGGSDGSSSTPNSGPIKIVSLSSTAKTIVGGETLPTESASTTVIAIVTNTKGLDAIAGGELRDEAGNVYGAFGAGADKGTFSSSVDWTTLRAIAAPRFANGQGARKLVARFFDNDGHVVESTITVGLACREGSELFGSCGGGTCMDTAIEGENCGGCGSACPVARFCSASACKPIGHTPNTGGSDCTRVTALSSATTCMDVCSAHGRNSSGATLWTDSTCTRGGGSLAAGLPIRSSTTAAYVRCTCPRPL